MVRFHLRQALRMFRRTPGFVATVVATLSLGIGGTAAIFSLVNGLLLRPLPGVKAPESLVALRTSEGSGGPGVSAYADFLDFSERGRSFQELAAFKPRRVDASTIGSAEVVEALLVTSSYFGVLRTEAQIGRLFGSEVDEGPSAHPEVILADGLWRRWFGADPAVVGRKLVVNGRPYTIIGVTERGFAGTSLVDRPELFVPMTMQPDLMPGSGYLLDHRGWGGVEIVGRLDIRVTAATAEAEVARIGQELSETYPQTNRGRKYVVTDFRPASLPAEARGTVVRMSALLMSVVAGLWLVVCLNVTNLFIARAMRQRQEFAVRIAMGASRSRLIGQTFLEFVPVALGAGVLGLGVARGLAGILATIPLPVALKVTIDLTTVLVCAGLAVVSAFICAVAPAWANVRADTALVTSPSAAIRGNRDRWPSRVLIVAQVSVSVVLLYATGLSVQTLANLARTDPGFDPDNIITAEFDPSLQGYSDAELVDFYSRLTETVLAIPGVNEAAMADVLPAASNYGSDTWFLREAEAPETPSRFGVSVVSAGYFETLGIGIVAGRPFDARDNPSVPPVLLVNEAAAGIVESRTGKGALGQELSLGNPDGPFLMIVGVVANIRTGREREAPPLIYGVQQQLLPLGLGGARMVLFLRTSVNPASVVPALRRAASSVDPNVSASRVVTMSSFMDSLLATERLIVDVLGASTILVLLQVALGLHGLLAYLVTLRTREFGIRRALGAGDRSVKAIVLREALVLSAAGIVLGALGASATADLLASFLLGVETIDPLSLLVGTGTILAVTWVASYVPARRAVAIDAVAAMKSD